MKASAIILAFFLFLVPVAHAVSTNDSDSINLAPLGHTADPTDESATDPTTGSGSQPGDSTPTTPTNTNPNTNTGPIYPGSNGSGDVVVVVGAPPIPGSPVVPPPTSVTTALATNGAISTSGGSSGSDQNSFSNGGSVTISPDKVREALAALGVTNVVIRGWDPATHSFITVEGGKAPPKGSRLASNDQELGLVAASASINDERLGTIVINDASVDLEYKTSGHILLVIPVTFMLKVSVNSTGATPTDRVRLTYPWYAFMTWMTVPPSELVTQIDSIIAETVAAGSDTEDSQARLFVAVAATLKRVHAEYEVGIRLLL